MHIAVGEAVALDVLHEVGEVAEVVDVAQKARDLLQVRAGGVRHGGDLAQVDHGEGGGVHCLRQAEFIVFLLHRVAEVAAEVRGFVIRAVVEVLDPFLEGGAVPRRELFRGDEVVGVRLNGHRGAEAAHHAGVDDDGVKVNAAVIQGGADFRNGHGRALGEVLVDKQAAVGAAAVIPEDEDVLLGGVVGGGPIDEGGKGRRIRHVVCLAEVLDEGESVLAVLPILVDAVGDVNVDVGVILFVGVPFKGAAGLDDEVDVGIRRGLADFVEVVGGHGAVGLEVGTAQIKHDGQLRGLHGGRAADAQEGGHCRNKQDENFVFHNCVFLWVEL